MSLDRTSILKRLISTRDKRGLEIGPLNRPVVKPDEGYIRYLDHLDTEGLRKKYRDDPSIVVQEIVDVDFALHGKSMLQAIGSEKFDYVIASHVIEHVPDVLGWLREISTLMQPGGFLSLAVPDKRFTFDCTRQTTEFAAVAEVWQQRRLRPSLRQCLDHVMEARAGIDQRRILDLWAGTLQPDQLPLAHLDFVESLNEEALVSYFKRIESGEYFDVHCSVFTPESFLLLLRKCGAAELIDFKVTAMTETRYGEAEFFCALEKLPSDLGRDERRSLIWASIDRFADSL